MIDCRFCGSKTGSVLNLGDLYPSDFIEDGVEIEPAPLHLVICSKCSLVQLSNTYNLDKMYREYWYKSGINKSMVQNLLKLVNTIDSRVLSLSPGDKVLDIGCNDGTLLSFYSPLVTKVGVDPALNLAEDANKHCDYFLNDYFSFDKLNQTLDIEHQYKIIYSVAMFYDLPDINSFVQDVTKCLEKSGVWVIQFTDLISMLSLNAFDNICHEHLEYYSLSVLKKIMEHNGLEIFDASYNKVNGGSLRVLVGWPGAHEINNSVDFFLKSEASYLKEKPIHEFAHRVMAQKIKLLKLLENLKDKKVYGLGASTKGNTLLQYYGLDSSQIEKIAEVSEAKFGKKTVGTNIPIIPESQALMENPDYFLVLPWHFRDFFVGVFSQYINNGGGLIFPLPGVSVVENSL